MPYASHHRIQHEQNWPIQCSVNCVHWSCTWGLQTSNCCKNAPAFTFSSVLSSLHSPQEKLHTSIDHILTSPELVGFPVLQRQKTISYNKVCKVACSQVSGSDLDSNNVLDLGLDFKLKSEERGRSTHLTGKLVPEMWLLVATKEAFWIRETVKWFWGLKAGGLS